MWVGQSEMLYASSARRYAVPAGSLDAMLSELDSALACRRRDFVAGMIVVPLTGPDLLEADSDLLSYETLRFETVPEDERVHDERGIQQLPERRFADCRVLLYSAARPEDKVEIEDFAAVTIEDQKVTVEFYDKHGLLIDPKELHGIVALYAHRSGDGNSRVN